MSEELHVRCGATSQCVFAGSECSRVSFGLVLGWNIAVFSTADSLRFPAASAVCPLPASLTSYDTSLASQLHCFRMRVSPESFCAPPSTTCPLGRAHETVRLIALSRSAFKASPPHRQSISATSLTAFVNRHVAFIEHRLTLTLSLPLSVILHFPTVFFLLSSWRSFRLVAGGRGGLLPPPVPRASSHTERAVADVCVRWRARLIRPFCSRRLRARSHLWLQPRSVPPR